jgi:hypothetical protein
MVEGDSVSYPATSAVGYSPTGSLRLDPETVLPDLTESVTTLKTEPRRPRRPRRKFYLQGSCLSFYPDYALDSMLDARDLSVKEEADGTSARLEMISNILYTHRSIWLNGL